MLPAENLDMQPGRQKTHKSGDHVDILIFDTIGTESLSIHPFVLLLGDTDLVLCLQQQCFNV